MSSKIFSLVAFLIICVGCSAGSKVDYSDLGLVKVSGVVTLDGNPLPNATVLFESPDGQFSYGVTDEQGRYQMSYDSVTGGVTPGEKIIRVRTKPMTEAEDDFNEEDEEPTSSQKKETLPEKFNTKSTLKITVPSPEYDIELQT